MSEIRATIRERVNPESNDVVERIVLRADVYDEYFSIWWNAAVDLHAFFDWVDYYVKSAARLRSHLDLRPKREKVRDAGYSLIGQTGESTASFSLVDGPEITVFPLDIFSRGTLFQDLSRNKAVSVRLFTPHGDFWHNFKPQVKTGMRMGFISHVCLSELIAQFISMTSPWELSRNQIGLGLIHSLAKFIPKP